MDVPRLADPIRIRALSHPLRIELLDVLADGPMTATQCAAATGESVASCSFHLRTLAKYGFIERAEPRGREKPWRLVGTGYDVRTEDDEPELNVAAEALAAMVLEHAAENVRAWIATLHAGSDSWNQVSSMSRNTCWATQDELRTLTEQVRRLTEPYDGRNDDPSARPAGARPIHVFAAVHPDVVKERRRRDDPAT